MSFTFLTHMPSPSEIKKQIPLSVQAMLCKQERDRLLSDVFTGKSNKFLVIIGPCSADNEDAVRQYIERLARVQEKTADKLVIVPRIYTNKPRTTGEGYKGIAHQPDPEKKPDLLNGLVAMRNMHVRSIEDYQLPAADEMLYPENFTYLEDLMAYCAIGARSVEDQHHRLTVSGFDIPSGMKNPTSGDLSVVLNSVYAAQQSHHFIYRGYEVKTTGNALTHVVLRGAVNKWGQSNPNYHYEDLVRLNDMYNRMDLKYPAAIIDANHANSNKQYEEQIRIVKETMHNRRISPDINRLVKGVMIESYLEPGCQDIHSHVFGQSITDPCLGWEQSEQLLYHIAEMQE